MTFLTNKIFAPIKHSFIVFVRADIVLNLMQNTLKKQCLCIFQCIFECLSPFLSGNSQCEVRVIWKL